MSRYNYKFNSEHFRHSMKPQDNGFHALKSKEYKIYEPKTSTDYRKDSTAGFQTPPSRYRDSFEDSDCHSRNDRYEAYQYKRHFDQKPYRNNYSYWAKENVKDDSNSTLNNVSPEPSSSKFDQNPRLEIERTNGSASTFESDSNNVSAQKIESRSSEDISRSPSDEISIFNSGEKMIKSAQGQVYDIQAFWEQIKNSNTNAISNPTAELDQQDDKRALEKRKQEDDIRDEEKNLEHEEVLSGKEKIKKVVSCDDIKETNMKNEKEKENDEEESEETEESDDDKYSNIDIMVEKKLMNNEYEANYDGNVFDDFNDEIRKEEIEDLNSDERPIWENSGIDNLIGEENPKDRILEIPAALLKLKSLKETKPPNKDLINQENMSSNLIIGTGDLANKDLNNPIPMNLCNENFLKSILKIGSNPADPCNQPVINQISSFPPQMPMQFMTNFMDKNNSLNRSTYQTLGEVEREVFCPYIPWTRNINRGMSFLNFETQAVMSIPRNKDGQQETNKDRNNYKVAEESLKKSVKESSSKRLLAFRIFNNSELTSAYHQKWECTIIDCSLCVNIDSFSNNSIINKLISKVENTLQESPISCSTIQTPSFPPFAMHQNLNGSRTFTSATQRRKNLVACNLFEEVTWKALVEQEELMKDGQTSINCEIPW